MPEVIKAVGDKMEVYVDGGIRDGSDVFKALALGARMVFVGRPVLWGLTYNGEKGVKQVLTILKQEFETILSLAGKANPNTSSLRTFYYIRTLLYFISIERVFF